MPSSSTPRVEVQSARREIALRLLITPETQVVSRHQERFIDQIPWSLQTSFYPVEFAARGASRLLMASDITEGTVRYLEQTLGVQQVGYRDWITSRRSNQNEQDFFRLPHDGEVFEIFRTAFDQNGQPLRVTITVFPADRNQFITDVGEVPDSRSDLGPDKPARSEAEPSLPPDGV